MPSCLRPIRLKNGNNVPCGYCTECRRRLSLSWSFRIQQEVKRATIAVFNTLTYDDDHLPCNSARVSYSGVFYSPARKGFIWLVDKDNQNPILVREDRYLQNRFGKDSCYLTHHPLTDVEISFPLIHDVPSVSRIDIVNYHKRLRHYFDGLDITIKYFLCSEYGSKTHRPHYHEILLFYGNDTKALSFDINVIRNAIAQSWQQGQFLAVDASNASVVNYTIKYIRKAKKNVPAGALNTFRLMSKGIGLDYLAKNRDSLSRLGKENIRIYFDTGKPSPLPRYFRDKLFDSSPLEDQIRINISKNTDYSQDYFKWLSRNNLTDNVDNRYRFHEIFYNPLLQNIRDNSTNKPTTIIEKL